MTTRVKMLMYLPRYLVHLRSRTLSNLTCSKCNLQVKMSQPFLTDKSIALYWRGWTKWQKKNGQKCPTVCTFGSTVSWLILTSRATCHKSSATVGGLTTQQNKLKLWQYYTGCNIMLHSTSGLIIMCSLLSCVIDVKQMFVREIGC